MEELTIINSQEVSFVNKQFGVEVDKINRAITSHNKSNWIIADAVRKIIEEELFVDDFKTEKDLADFMGMSRPNLNKLKNASAKRVGVDNDCLDGFTVAQVMEMAKVENIDIPTFLKGYNVSPNSTIQSIREAVQCYKEDNAIEVDSSLIDEEKSEAENTKSSTSNSDDVDEETIDKIVIEITKALNTASEKDFRDIYAFMISRGMIDGKCV